MKIEVPYIHPTVRKRLFINLLGVNLIVLSLVAFALVHLIIYPGQSILNQVLVIALVAVISIFVLFAGLGLTGMLIALIYDKRIRLFQRPMRIAINLFFPLILGLGKILNIEVDSIKRSFVEVNNQIVRANNYNLDSGQVMILAPHCLQRTKCPHKITTDVGNCRRCGGCCIGDLLDLCDRYGVKVGVATGGTLARKYITDYRPIAVVAIACERDLTSGIQDAFPLPVLGVTNQRPNGPCNNTYIDIDKVEEAVNFFINGEGGRK